MSMKIMVITSNRYNCVIPAFAHQFNKYWSSSAQVDVVGDEPPTEKLPDNFNFIHSGKDDGKSSWSNLMISYLNNVDDEYTLLFFDDHFITGKIDLDVIQEAITLMNTEGYDKLWGGQIDGKYEQVSDNLQCLTGYITKSFTPSIWRTSILKQILEPNKDPHTSEKGHALHAKTLKGLSKCVIPTADLIRRGELRTLNSPWNYGAWRTGDGFGDESDLDLYLKYQNVWNNK